MKIPIVIALVTGLAALWTGRSFTGLSTLRLRHSWIIFVALGVQVFFVAFPPSWLTPSSATPIFVLTLAAPALFLAMNRQVAGMLVVAIGLTLNCLVILANGAMPVSSSAARVAGAELLTDTRHVEHGTHLRNETMTEETVLPILGDVIPMPGMKLVASPGDLILAAGLVQLVWSRTTKRSGRAEALAV
ncbi:MAG: hypothetical protein QOG04_297 [Actinomycetota bacterium]|jgi:hypothetical protein|nr:hypothetical protein [Actinomycetota bacterium]